MKSKAGHLQQLAAELLTKAKEEKESAAALKAKYYKTMDDYSEAVDKIDAATQQAQSILDQMNAQSLVLAQVALILYKVTAINDKARLAHFYIHTDCDAIRSRNKSWRGITVRCLLRDSSAAMSDEVAVT